MTVTTPQQPQVKPTAAKAGSGVGAPSRGTVALSLQAHALAHAQFDAAAAAVMNQLVLMLQCERVSLGLCAGTQLRIAAISGANDVDEKHRTVAGIAAAMTEALEQNLAIVHPMPAGASPAIARAHGELALANGQAAIYSVPIATRHEVMGVLLFERRGGFDGDALRAAQDAAMFVGPLLALKQRADGSVRRQVVRAFGGAAPGLFGTRALPVGRTLSGAALLGLVALLLWPATHRVVAPARLEGAVQQVIAAPVDGFVGSVAVRPGETVKAGQALATLDNRELALERDRWAAEAAQLDKQYREALSRDDATPIVIAQSKLEQAQSQHALVLQQLERATLRAPMDGIVLSGDLTQSVGMPLKRGQELMTIAPDRGWRVVAEVDEQEIEAIREGQHAQVLFAAVGNGTPLRFDVQRIAPVATQSEAHNVFEVEGLPAAQPEGLRPGMRGVARIEIGASTWGAIWWERARQAWQRLSWRLLG